MPSWLFPNPPFGNCPEEEEEEEEDQDLEKKIPFEEAEVDEIDRRDEIDEIDRRDEIDELDR